MGGGGRFPSPRSFSELTRGAELKKDFEDFELAASPKLKKRLCPDGIFQSIN